ncbi:unnamed protein product [Chironomus riparius]|uniref:omega-amidase n=1 Tax=Chironomus riparius TaxID=315576 RepID=A0A9N9S170_9DIPT|nr:unnamed protein product [Chironomus riparius]
MSESMRKLRVGCIQITVSANKAENVARAVEKIREAKKRGAELVVLPECFNSFISNDYYGKYAEPIPGETTNILSKLAKELEIFIIGGTIPENDGDKLFNTATVWGKSGELMGKFRKMHLFDIDIPNEMTFRESDSLSPGNELTIINIKDFKIGLGICYDVRFEELAKLYRKQGCNLLVYPSAFGMKTGPLHWELVGRSRANDNQLYTVLTSQGRDLNGPYVAYGHSYVADPWGKMLFMAGTDDELFIVDLDLDVVDKVRSNIPIFIQRRADIYDTVQKN